MTNEFQLTDMPSIWEILGMCKMEYDNHRLVLQWRECVLPDDVEQPPIQPCFNATIMPEYTHGHVSLAYNINVDSFIGKRNESILCEQFSGPKGALAKCLDAMRIEFWQIAQERNHELAVKRDEEKRSMAKLEAVIHLVDLVDILVHKGEQNDD